MWWINFQQAMVAREEPVVGQAEMSFGCAANQKRIVLGKVEYATLVWTGNDFEVYLHLGGSRAERTKNVLNDALPKAAG